MAAEERLVDLQKGANGEYIAVVWPGSNPSGVKPIGSYVLVRVDPFSPVTSGGIHHLDARIERMTMASQSGCVYAMGEAAFTTNAYGRPWAGEKPPIGARVYYEQYAGIPCTGEDGETYRIMEHTAIAAVIGVGVGVGEDRSIYPAGGERGPGEQ